MRCMYTLVSLEEVIDILLFFVLVLVNMQPMEVYDPNVFDILARINVYRLKFRVTFLSVEYSGNNMNTNDRMCHDVERNKVQPVQWLIYNFLNLLEKFHYEMCIAHEDYQIKLHLCLVNRVVQVMPFHRIIIGPDNPENL